MIRAPKGVGVPGTSRVAADLNLAKKKNRREGVEAWWEENEHETLLRGSEAGKQSHVPCLLLAFFDYAPCHNQLRSIPSRGRRRQQR